MDAIFFNQLFTPVYLFVFGRVNLFAFWLVRQSHP